MEDYTYRQTAINATQKLGQQAKQSAQIHGYKVAKLGAQGFIYACKALLQQVFIVVKEMVKPGSTRRF